MKCLFGRLSPHSVIKRVIVLMTLTCLCLPSMAQHPFYVQTYEEGKEAMQLEDWDRASEFLEIAAFGLLDHTDYLGDIYVRLAIVQASLEDSAKLIKFLAKAKSQVGAVFNKPERTPAPVWERFLIVSGRKKAPPPPIPKEVSELEAYVSDHPKVEKGWLALLPKKREGRASVNRRWFERALDVHPKSVPILQEALFFAEEHDRGRQAESFAKRLFDLDPENSLVNEFYGNAAVDADKYSEAGDFYKKVTGRPRFSETEAIQARLEEELEKLKKARERMELAKEREAKKAEADRKKRLEEREARLARERAEEAKAAAAKAQRKREEESRKTKREERAARDRKSTSDKAEASKSEKTAEKAEPDPLVEQEALVRAKPEDVDARFVLARMYLEVKETRKARRELRKLGRIEADSPRYAEIFAEYNYLLERHKRNLDVLKGRRDLTRRTLYFYGLSLFETEKYEEARQILSDLSRSEFPKLRNVDAEIRKNLAKGKGSAKLGGPTPRHIVALERSVADGEAKPIDRIRLIDYYLSVENWKKAEPLIEDGYREFSKNQEFLFFHGRSELHHGKFKEALELFQRLLNAGYRKRDIHYYAGLAAMKDGKTAVADYLFKMAENYNTQLKDEIRSLQSEQR